MSPYALFVVSGVAQGFGIAWSAPESMYALSDPHPDDIQDRLPLDTPVVMDLTFPKAASLRGALSTRPAAGRGRQAPSVGRRHA